MRLLLDTCPFLWVISGSKELSHTARAAFVDPANEVFLSSASAWEIVTTPDDAIRGYPVRSFW